MADWRRRQARWAATERSGERTRIAKLHEEFRRGCPPAQDRRRDDWLGTDDECAAILNEKRIGRWRWGGAETRCSEEMLRILSDVAAKGR
ncbi:hypothetical protein DSM21852_41730 [Methylocystis bryophila]|uniref:Uncharacterized protein n=1 Tax=Methylocystis bryophila TaxID=655015 RepID=A0A1W6MTB1_9HYPH|nr:hypothetical protein B1812_06815 [Methylocystis bryophila]BDV40920.1 hypothetical protein DSM21852_41730 [Methylocystis bryophila]